MDQPLRLARYGAQCVGVDGDASGNLNFDLLHTGIGTGQRKNTQEEHHDNPPMKSKIRQVRTLTAKTLHERVLGAVGESGARHGAAGARGACGTMIGPLNEGR